MKVRHLAICLLALLGGAALGAQELPKCVHPEAAALIFPGERSALDSLYVRLDSLLATGSGNLNIWHVGGSHVQGAIFPNRIRDDIDSLTLRGDRGFLFPLALANTNTDKSYLITATGEWEAPILTRNSPLRRPRYGITGYGARTSSPDASVAFRLNPDGGDRWECSLCQLTPSYSIPTFKEGT